MAPRRFLSAALLLLLLAGSCGRQPAVLGREVSGCGDALRERAAAFDAIDVAEKRAIELSRGRAGELQGIGGEGKHAAVSAADLAPCDAAGSGRGVAVDLADLRARYQVVIDRTIGRLTETAAQPPPAPQHRGDNKGKGGGTKGGD